MPRNAHITRRTKETDIDLVLELDGAGRADVDTGVGFLDHMLELLAKHGGFDLSVKATGDLDVDAHHTVEDVAICLGKALAEALGDKAGINRFGSADVPMDEALARVAIDLSGRAYYLSEGELDPEYTADDFLQALAVNALCNLHVEVPHGRNAHHIQEAVFKAVALALKRAVALGGTPGDVPSTKGVL